MKRDLSPEVQQPPIAQPISMDVLREKYLKFGEVGAEDVFVRVARAWLVRKRLTSRNTLSHCF